MVINNKKEAQILVISVRFQTRCIFFIFSLFSQHFIHSMRLEIHWFLLSLPFLKQIFTLILNILLSMFQTNGFLSAKNGNINDRCRQHQKMLKRGSRLFYFIPFVNVIRKFCIFILFDFLLNKLWNRRSLEEDLNISTYCIDYILSVYHRVWNFRWITLDLC